jgi:hypothetical protein
MNINTYTYTYNNNNTNTNGVQHPSMRGMTERRISLPPRETDSHLPVPLGTDVSLKTKNIMHKNQ